MLWGLLILFGAALGILVILGTIATAWFVAHPPRRTTGTAVARQEPTDPREAGYEFSSEMVRLPDGTDVEVWDVQGRDPDGPIILMLHGWGDGRLGELLWLDVLGPTASRLLLYDQRGHGESPTRRCTWGVKEADDARHIVAWAQQRHPGKPFVLFGYSMGAAVALHVAAEPSEVPIRAIVADSPYAGVNDVVRATMRSNRLPTWPTVPVALGFWRLCGGAPREKNLVEVIRRVNVPVLILHGVEDCVAPLTDAQRLADAAPDGRLVIFDSCDHLQAGCAEPQRYADEIRSLVQRLVEEIKKARPTIKWDRALPGAR